MLKFLDLFGTSFQFTVFKNDKYKTNLGGIVTIISVIIIIIFIYLFGRDIFLKLNPVINQENKIKNTYGDPLNLTNNNSIIAFRIEDSSLSYTSFENYLFPNFQYKGFKKNDINVNVLVENFEINYQRCDKLNLTDNYFKETFNLSQWFCLDFSESSAKLGGYWEGDFVNYLELKLNFTDSKGNYDSEKLKQFLNKGRFISLLLPTSYFDFSDQVKPLKKNYKYYFYKLNLVLGKYDRIYLQNMTSVDNRGWLFDENHYDELISTNIIRSDFYNVDPKDEQFNYLYRAVFYLEKDYVEITRNYMKIQDLGARMGGFISFIMLVCRIITLPYNLFKRSESLYNLLFDFKENDSKKNQITTTNSERLKSINLDITQMKSTKLSNSVKIELSNKNENNLIHFGFFQTIKFQLFPKCVSKNQIKNKKLYNFLSNYITERLDISYYIKFTENVKHFRILTLDNKEQNLSFDYIKNPNLNDKHDLNLFEIELEKDPEKEIIQLINYYRKLKESRKIKEFDRELYGFLDSKITKYVGNLD